MVPTLTCGLVRSNFSFAMIYPMYVSRKQNLVPAPVGTGTALLLTTTCADDLLGNVVRSLSVTLALHAICCMPLSRRTWAGGATEQSSFSHHGLHDRSNTDSVSAALSSTTGGTQNTHPSDFVLDGCFYFVTHRCRKQDRICFSHPIFKSHQRG